MTTATTIRPSLSFVGVPLSDWAFGIRIWVAVTIALAASFWLELEAPSSAAVTVAILAMPTRGQALEKACYRLLATLIGVTAAIAITAVFSQARDVLLVVFAGWIGLCVYVALLLDGNRAYAAVLSGYTVAVVAIQQIDTPEKVFETGVARGAAIAVGIASVALVNDLLAAPDSFPRLALQLATLHRRVREYAKLLLRGEAADAAMAAGLLRDIAALRPEMASLSPEASGGFARSAAARSAAVALVAEVYAARALNALPSTDQGLRELAAKLDGSSPLPSPFGAAKRKLDAPGALSLSPPAAFAARELLRRDAEVQEGLAALNIGVQPRQAWRTPLYYSHRIAAAAGIRSAVCVGLTSAFFVLAGWPTTDVALSLIAVLIGLGATTPNPTAFTILASIAMPIAVVLAGALEFLILDGVNEFALLALALAPFMIGATVLMTRPNQALSALGRLNLIFILVIFAPSNPPSYDPQSFLFISVLACVAAALLLAAQVLVPTASNERQQGWIMASARSDFAHVLARRDRRLSPEEAMFRDAVRIRQITTSGKTPQPSAIQAEGLSYFDRAAAVRLSRANLTRLAATSLSPLAVAANEALSAQDTQRLRAVSATLRNIGGAESAFAEEVSDQLALAAVVIDASVRPTAPAKGNLS
jgi:uncharacterized membrane protein YccC